MEYEKQETGKIGRLLKLYRAVSETGVRELAKELGMSSATLSRIESGREMDQQSLGKIMRWLFGWK